MALGRLYFALQALAGAIWWSAVFLSPVVRAATLGSLPPVAVAVVDIPLFVVASALAAAGIRAGALVATAWTIVATVALALFATAVREAGWGVVLMSAASAGSVVAACLLLLGRVPTKWAMIGPFSFRTAAESSRRGHIARTFAELAVFWAVFLGILPLIVLFLERRWRLSIPVPGWVGATGLVVLLLASALGLWAAMVMSSRGEGTPLPAAMPRHLVIAGPYRFVRNPMAVSGIAQGVAVGLLLGSWLIVGYAIIGSLIWNWGVRPHEEADLAERFGDEFIRYRDRVRCWVPGRAIPITETRATEPQQRR